MFPYETRLPSTGQFCETSGNMPLESCPVDPMETAEAFVMKQMDPREALVYEQHLAHCRACSEIVEMTRAFVQGMRDASRQLADDDDEKPN
jgi:hypothetical protein